jgi:iron complex outermembrane receptor protein
MKKFTLLSLAAVAALATEPVTIQKITVEASAPKADGKNIVADEMVKFSRQSDLGEMLSQTLPEITHVRASAVGNDIILRGLKKDNINVTIDDAKVCGACPNRMDPPAMHVSSSQIASVEVKEGPFDVTQFGSLGGTVNVVTKDPSKGLHGEVSATLGSYDYRKVGATVEGGNDTVQALVGYSRETSGQYKDGDGRTMAEQLVARGAATADQYKTSETNRDAYERMNFWTKVVFTPTNSDKITLSYFGDRADDVLYPAFQMDAQVDDTDMFSAKYQKFNLSEFSDELKLEAYHSKVVHEMGTEFRNSSSAAATYRTHAVEATIKGARIENTVALSDIKTTLGVDTSIRNWYGRCLNEPSRTLRETRLPDVDTKNIGVYAEAAKSISNIDLSAGLRYDSTSIEPNYGLASNTTYSATLVAGTLDSNINPTVMPEREFDNISANVMAKYNFSSSTNLFVGIGQSVRVPDAKELYFDGSMPANDSAIAGVPTLNETINREIDLGAESTIGNLHLKGTMFYSDLKDFIYSTTTSTNSFANIDAKIVGFDLTANYALSNEWMLETAMAYQKGTKKDPSQLGAAHTDEDLAEIPPMKGRVALVMDTGINYFMTEWMGARFQSIDSQSGEKEIAGYGLLNLKYGHDFQNGFSIMAGINNFFDKTYAVSNSYVGRGLLTGTTTAPTILNEMGQNFYTTLSYKF